MKNLRWKWQIGFPVFLLLTLFVTSVLYAGPSTITVVDGKACMGEDKSRQQTESLALTHAKRQAVEYAATYLKSETHVKDLEIEKDLVNAYANATVRIIEEIEKNWYRDPAVGECYRIKVKMEVVPDDKAMEQLTKAKDLIDQPDGPLQVQVWTDKKTYRQAEKIKVYVKGNKPFYARVLHRDVKGHLLQLLPNAFRKDNYFNGGVVYEIPSGHDRFELEVTPPFGEESIIVYSSRSPLGDINLQDAGGVYQVKTKTSDVEIRTRGVKIKEKGEGKASAASEFFEGKVTVRTGK
jgi:hypothetical protein